jgi:RNase H-fold protein (predicted Holliday junction resolvase)
MKPPDQAQGPILAIDPGRHKCGVAVVDRDGKVLHRGVSPTGEIASVAARLIDDFGVALLLVGDRTGAKNVCRALLAQVPLQPVLIDEHRSTEQARRRFLQENPRRGWRRLLPITLLTPDRPYDDYVAVLLAERYLAGISNS